MTTPLDIKVNDSLIIGEAFTNHINDSNTHLTSNEKEILNNLENSTINSEYRLICSDTRISDNSAFLYYEWFGDVSSKLKLNYSISGGAYTNTLGIYDSTRNHTVFSTTTTDNGTVEFQAEDIIGSIYTEYILLEELVKYNNGDISIKYQGNYQAKDFYGNPHNILSSGKRILSTINFTDIKVGDDLTGFDMYFNNLSPFYLNPSSTYDNLEWIITTNNGSFSFYVSKTDSHIYTPGSNVYSLDAGDNVNEPHWRMNSCSIPDNTIVYSISCTNPSITTLELFNNELYDYSFKLSDITLNKENDSTVIGNSLYESNILGSSVRPFYNNDKEIALMDDIEKSNFRIISNQKFSVPEGLSIGIKWNGDTRESLHCLVNGNEIFGNYDLYDRNGSTFYSFIISSSSFIIFTDNNNNSYYEENVIIDTRTPVFYDYDGSINTNADGSFKLAKNDGTIHKFGSFGSRILFSHSLSNIGVGSDLSGLTISFNPNGMTFHLDPNSPYDSIDYIVYINGLPGLTFYVDKTSSIILTPDTDIYSTETAQVDVTVPAWININDYTFPPGSIVTQMDDFLSGISTWEAFEAQLASDSWSWKPSMATIAKKYPSIDMGNIEFDAKILGNSERPFYNDDEIALINDINNHNTDNTSHNSIVTSFESHRSTDISRWANSYNTERLLYLEILTSRGLKLSTTDIEDISAHDINNPYTVTNELGCFLDLDFQNINNVFTEVYINDVLMFSSEGLVNAAEVRKSFILNTQDKVYFGGLSGSALCSGVELDNESSFIKIYQELVQKDANLQAQILDIKASLNNKVLDSTVTDITNTTYTVNNLLGARVEVLGLNLLLGSTGVLTVNGESKYDNTGLLSLLAPVPIGLIEVEDGDVIVSSGCSYAKITNYIAG